MLNHLLNTRLADTLLAAFERITGAVLISANEPDLRPELTRADNAVRTLHRRLRTTKHRAMDAEQRVEIATRLFSADRRERIVTAHNLWPTVPVRTIALITNASPSYVSEILNDGKDEDEHQQQPTPNN